MSETFKTYLPLWILTIVGVIMTVQYFLPWDFLLVIKSYATSWTVIIAMFTLLLGVGYSLNFYTKRVIKYGIKGEGLYSLVFLAVFLIFTITGFVWGSESSQYMRLYLNINKPVASVVYAMCFFWCIGAAYKAFTLSSFDVTALMLAGIIYTLRNVPFGPIIFPPIVPIFEWVTSFIQVPGTRGGTITAALGAIVIAIRILMQKERGVIGEARRIE